MVDNYSRESAPQQKVRSIVVPIAQKQGQKQPGDLASQAVASKLWDTDDTHGAQLAFLSRFIVLQAIGGAGIVGLWVAGIADKPFAGDNGFLCWLIAAIGALDILCVFLRRWRDVDWLATHVVRIGLLGTVVGLIVAFSAARAGGSAFAVLAAMQTSSLHADSSRIGEIRERLENANRWRDHVMVVAHRGGGMEGDRKSHPENSIAAVRSAIDLGVEMVELDIQKSSDGEFVVFHNSWLDRSSTCKGELAQRTLAELKQCRLVIAGTGVATEESIPTLREMLVVTRDRIFINIDNKLDIEALPAIVAVAREMGMADQIVIKRNLWSAEKIAEMTQVLERAGGGAIFMPIIADDAVRDPKFLEATASAFSADAVELIAWHTAGEPMTADGGPLFGAKARAVAARGDWHLWVNTYAIANKAGGMLSGGRGDELATLADFPAATYGFWVDRGATIIQTDEPAAAIEWLTANGFRVPYASDAAATRQAAAEVPLGQ